MNPNLHSFASRRRKLNVEEVFEVYSEAPEKSRKIAPSDEMMMCNDMDVDTVQTTHTQDEFPVNSFPLMGLNDWMQNSRLATTHPTKQLMSPLSTSAPGVVFNGGEKEMSGATDSKLLSGLSDHVSGNQHNMPRQHTPGSGCPDCLSGKSGHFYHIQTRLQGKDDNMQHQN
ncbi:uncharacterized protein [Littorina saxatilis]|uniref:Uncharacterized protein n=1 Tax=Littorina saxatilis TaxID=31220 RepID=A0AAN9BRL1_9CAEN